jgi:hypothetical protein
VAAAVESYNRPRRRRPAIVMRHICKMSRTVMSRRYALPATGQYRYRDLKCGKATIMWLLDLDLLHASLFDIKCNM